MAAASDFAATYVKGSFQTLGRLALYSAGLETERLRAAR